MSDEIREVVLRALKDVAPDADPATLDDGADLREALDLDSMDFLRFVQALHAALGVEIPEKDYGSVRTLRAVVDYVTARRPPPAG